MISFKRLQVRLASKDNDWRRQSAYLFESWNKYKCNIYLDRLEIFGSSHQVDWPLNVKHLLPHSVLYPFRYSCRYTIIHLKGEGLTSLSADDTFRAVLVATSEPKSLYYLSHMILKGLANQIHMVVLSRCYITFWHLILFGGHSTHFSKRSQHLKTKSTFCYDFIVGSPDWQSCMGEVNRSDSNGSIT